MKIIKKNISGVTLIEILIGIVITTIIMGAMYTTYSVVNKTYSQVSEKAGISESSRDLVSMLMRDIRMAGFKYYVGSQTKQKYAQDTLDQCPPGGLLLPSLSYFGFNNGYDNADDSHNPIVIRKKTIGDSDKVSISDTCCDSIEIVYEDFNINDKLQPFIKYKILYFAEKAGTDKGYAVFKTVKQWSQKKAASACSWPLPETGSWETVIDKEMIREYVEDMEFIPFDENGLIVKDTSGDYPDPGKSGRKDSSGNDIRDRLMDIRGVDIRITFRSKENFFDRVRTDRRKPKQLLSGRVETDSEDKPGDEDEPKDTGTELKLRDSVLVTVNTRNIGGDLFK